MTTMLDESAPIIIDLAKDFMGFIRGLEPRASRAYFRFEYEELRDRCNGSYVTEGGATIINAVQHSAFFDSMKEKARRLMHAHQKTHGVFLLVIDAEFNYEIKFDWDNLQRWIITKLNGRTGIPDDLEVATRPN